MPNEVGRPRNPALAGAILNAARALLVENGFDSLSVDAIASRAGTTRPAFYRRYEGLPEMLLALMLEDFGTDIEFNYGDVRSDLLAIQRDQIDLFTSPIARQCLSVFLGALQSSPALNTDFQAHFLRPRREATGRILARAAGRGEIRSDYDPESICDLLTGPLLMRIVLPGVGPLDQRIVEDTVDSSLALLGHEPTVIRVRQALS
jgi:AcrR family transcriptional regulator